MNPSKKHVKVSDTAFVTCSFRSKNDNLSQDRYAKLWTNERAETILEDYLENVSTEEVSTHCIRNRYFLETLAKLVEQEKIDLLINFGAGFSMYPFLLPDTIEHIEIDKPEVVDYKSEQVKQWMENGTLPKRHITSIPVDFSTDYQAELISTIESLKQNRRCFILIEGVLFFLNREQTDGLFHLFSEVQAHGDYVGSVSYKEDVKATDAYKRLIAYANKGVDDASDDGFQTIPNSYYLNLKDYDLLEQEDYYSCSKLYHHNTQSKPTDILNEQFYVLKRKP
ncbi:class I SAM-dependent methyltransferase [Winogradskyella maritima]|uniref:Class I SAM-dependent methyltransferase n=1 Tax=Winogradskyella maritima TaxID=1517766 RepID=A0ABV8AHS6_9FLAO|nr:class I SAM-dependent methyltransferase [Winogradskyella maritima]